MKMSNYDGSKCKSARRLNLAPARTVRLNFKSLFMISK